MLGIAICSDFGGKCLRWLLFIFLMFSMPAVAQTKDARPLSRVLQEGGRVVAASGELVWVETDLDTYMCVIELKERFRSSLKRRNVRELYANWPAALRGRLDRG
jgi:preprotein translocase subunit YajC